MTELVECPRCLGLVPKGYCALCKDTGEVPAAMAIEYKLISDVVVHHGYVDYDEAVQLRRRYDD